MGYVEAFRKLGYEIRLPRSDVSAERADGVAIAIIRQELDPRTMSFDSRLVVGWEEQRMPLQGNSRRIQHLRHSVDQLDGRVEVVLVDKKQGGKLDGAEPWTRADSFWKITYFEPKTGHHRIELVKQRA